ncbi:DNA-processing protein DprA [Holophaga foetida]|uniref:DNA-processing protein DprA n=1 Tax=Holophaga foetida TaxID=35839 RepID=UPI0002472ADC|nr:DNA-processing protein DprA [Holophaga foetida]
MNNALWALAFSLLAWPERRKAELWEELQYGTHPVLAPREALDLERLERELPRHREEAHTRGARLCLPGDEDLARFLDPLPYPVALWVRGTLPPPGPALALVGSRQASHEGRARAWRWGRELTRRGVRVLSGLARGIDGAAHGGALEAGPTWGILGSGLDHPYPPEHGGLMERMVRAGGGVITPFPPSAPPRKWHFPRRNLILAAWVHGVVVVEAGLRSGSLLTGRLALDLGKELWVCPGAPENSLMEGPNHLLREGAARVCRSVQDLLEDLNLPLGT